MAASQGSSVGTMPTDENPEHASQLARIGNRSRRTFVTNAPASRGLRAFTHFIHPVNVYRDRVRDGDVGHTRKSS